MNRSKRSAALLLLLCGCYLAGHTQSYTQYFTGNATDVSTNPQGGVCMMGGATENDAAMRWFLQRAAGGDVLVLRASGSNGYNNYLYSELGVAVNSVETIVFNNAAATDDAYIHQKIKQAEAIWFAGGDQWKYVSYWRNDAIGALINEAIQGRNIVIGGTSAGMAILGGVYFSAQNGTITSNQALANPYDAKVVVDSSHFLEVPYLQHTITDTHYDNPNRKGRHMVFLARMVQDYGMAAKGIACEEYTAVCIDENGMARVFGGHPQHDDNAFFLQVNCELETSEPEQCAPGEVLVWDREGLAVKVYSVKGTPQGQNSFNLTDWASGQGGTWQRWYVKNGSLLERSSEAPNCLPVNTDSPGDQGQLLLFPNPGHEQLHIQLDQQEIVAVSLLDQHSRPLVSKTGILGNSTTLAVDNISPGIYFMLVQTAKGNWTKKWIKQP
ncbi:MAG: T9SS type A sorting domain-containing protein [Saprospiraceae bacterium]|nr:T9SS type A sorting domain-containing protein [Saprospiraceae bacterium]